MSAVIEIAEACRTDLEGIVALDRVRAGEAKPAYWLEILGQYLDHAGGDERVAVVARDAGGVCGFLFGEVRAWEFGSERCGWIFAVSVSPAHEREGLATRLCEEAFRRFGAMGVDLVRTMVRRRDVPMLALFRSMGFVAGPFSELEMAIESEPTA